MMIVKIIENYKPINEQEAIDKKAMLNFIKHNNDALYRTNLIAHFTSSAIVVNKTKDKVLFIYHLIYKSWSWVGGHNDGEPDFLKVALKETIEETGVKSIRPLLNDPVALDNINVENHIKNGHYVGDHIHMNITYLLEADEEEETHIKADENSGVKWFLIKDVLKHVDEKRMLNIYRKVFDKLDKLKEL